MPMTPATCALDFDMFKENDQNIIHGIKAGRVRIRQQSARLAAMDSIGTRHQAKASQERSSAVLLTMRARMCCMPEQESHGHRTFSSITFLCKFNFSLFRHFYDIGKKITRAKGTPPKPQVLDRAGSIVSVSHPYFDGKHVLECASYIIPDPTHPCYTLCHDL